MCRKEAVPITETQTYMIQLNLFQKTIIQTL